LTFDVSRQVRAALRERGRLFGEMVDEFKACGGDPDAWVDPAGHSQGSITERYIHAAQVLFPGAAERGEARTFAALYE
jgi:hypothetical protein